ncbi:MAG TPA: ThuA domain-containing protein [Clostridia bacterium]|jgi:trehalose utilization protein|nr:MAG: Trehalose utilization [Firmicutes bacterium ADurb.Bin146]HOD92410.1 ThuA domain-containing protein [Clostridia bacterium]HQM38767.1 ThuA domain-containing protein [Clostridia bacterium]
MSIHVTIWNEFIHEKKDESVRRIYPNGIHNALKDQLSSESDFVIKTATLDQPEHGLTEEVINHTDVLLWWGHMAHGQVKDEIVNKIADRVRKGMGIILLHSAHASKLMKCLTGCTGSLSWREQNEKQILWNLKPNHPITKGIGEYIVLDKEETYGEPFGIPDPDECIFLSWFSGGNVFRSGWIKNVQNGKLFYFQPGHETFPSYMNPEVIKVIINAIRYLKPLNYIENVDSIWQKEPITS